MNENGRSVKQKGFTLLELVVAFFLVTVLLLPLLTILQKELISAYRLHILQMALSLAQEEIEGVLDSTVPEKEIKDRMKEVHLRNHTFRVVRDVVDGKGKGEPEAGTDPLEVWVKIYHGREEDSIARLVTLKEDW